MTDAISITGIEHSPSTTTLFIHYTITRAGTWRHYPSYSGYRDLLSNFWIIMIPDTGSGRHTSFPVVVAEGGMFTGTFAWNYGSIRGVNPENFDNNKSFFIQLAIFTRGQSEIIIDPPTNPIITPASLPPLIIQSLPTDPPERKDPDRPPPTPPPPSRPRVPGGVPVPPLIRPVGPGEEPEEPKPEPGIPVDPFPGGIGPVIPEQPDEPKDTGPGDPMDPFPGGIGPVVRPVEPGEEPDEPKDTGPGDPVVRPVGPGEEPDEPKDTGPGDPMDPFPGGIGPGTGGGNGGIPTDPFPGGVIYPGDPGFEEAIDGFEEPIDPPEGGSGSDINYKEEGRKVNLINIPPVSEVTQSIINTQNPIRFITPSAQTSIEPSLPGEPIRVSKENPNSFQSIVGRSRATSTEGNVLPGQKTSDSKLDRTSLQSTQGVDDGYLTKYNYKEKAKGGIIKHYSLEKLDASYLIPGTTVYLEIPIDDIPKGESIFVSSAFKPPRGLSITASLQLWMIDSQGRNMILSRTSAKLATDTDYLTLSYSIASYNFELGPVTIIAMAVGKNSKIIGIASKKAIIRPTLAKLGTDSDNRIREPRNITTASTLPASVIDQVNISRPPVPIYVKDGKAVKLIVNKIDKSENKFSAVLVGPGYNSVSSYKIDVFSMTEVYRLPSDDPIIALPEKNFSKYPSLPTLISNKKLISSTTRLKLNEEEIYPDSHIVGISNFVVSDKELLLIIGPQSLPEIGGNRKFDLYLGDSYDIKGFSMNIIKVNDGRHTIRGYCPYVKENLALLLHGKDPNNIPENYSLQFVVTDERGFFNWPGVFISSDEYYSIILPRYNQFNAYNGVVFKSKI